VRERSLDIDAALVVDPARRVRDRDHRRAELRREPREDGADVAEALHDDAQPFGGDPLPRQRLAQAEEDTAAGRLLAAERAAMVSGLPVTTESTEWPWFMENVSKIQAIT